MRNNLMRQGIRRSQKTHDMMHIHKWTELSLSQVIPIRGESRLRGHQIFQQLFIIHGLKKVITPYHREMNNDWLISDQLSLVAHCHQEQVLKSHDHKANIQIMFTLPSKQLIWMIPSWKGTVTRDPIQAAIFERVPWIDLSTIIQLSLFNSYSSHSIQVLWCEWCMPTVHI